MKPSGSKPFLPQQPLHNPAARKEVLHVQPIDPAHQLELRFTSRARRVI